MKFPLHHTHSWDVSPREAQELQRELAPLVRAEPLEAPVETIAGVDVSIRGDLAQAAIAVLRLPALDIADRAVHRATCRSPTCPAS